MKVRTFSLFIAHLDIHSYKDPLQVYCSFSNRFSAFFLLIWVLYIFALNPNKNLGRVICNIKPNTSQGWYNPSTYLDYLNFPTMLCSFQWRIFSLALFLCIDVVGSFMNFLLYLFAASTYKLFCFIHIYLVW